MPVESMAPDGVTAGLRACASSHGSMTILAIDHRQNLRKLLPPGAPDAALRRFKEEVVRSLAPGATAVLLDPELGLPHCAETGALPAGVGLVVALEATGYEGDATARRSRILDGWGVEQARHGGATALKLLLYYHPRSASADHQERLLELVARDARRAALPLFVEVLTHAIEPGAASAPADRRRLIIESARRLGGIGGDVLKVEFPGDPAVEDGAEWDEACAALTEAIAQPWVLLSAKASPEAFLRQAGAACRAGATGVAVGRAVWGDATDLDGDARLAFLAGEGRRRLVALRDVVDRTGRRWSAARAFAPA